MSILAAEEMKMLMEATAGPCISLYMSTHRHIPETGQDPIRFKNMLADAEQRLIATGMRSTDVRALIAPAHKLLYDPTFWKFQSDGLAMYLSPHLFRYHCLPFNFIETLVVGERFHLKPLWQMLADDQRYFILAASQKSVRLLEATGYGVSEVKLDDVPENIGEILARYDFEEQQQFHTRAPSSGAARSAVFHGQGLGKEDVYKRIKQYLSEVDKGLQNVLKNETGPLVLAGVSSILPLYKSVNTYRNLVAEGIPGNPDQVRDEELREKAWQIVQPALHSSRNEAREKFEQMIGTGRASGQLEAVVPAAYTGQIESIFVPVGIQRWGLFDPQNNAITLHESARASDNDLLDFAALYTWLNNGKVYSVAADEVPGNGVIAAVYRY